VLNGAITISTMMTSTHQQHHRHSRAVLALPCYVHGCVSAMMVLSSSSFLPWFRGKGFLRLGAALPEPELLDIDKAAD
jgi:hypothetical protein